MDSLFKYEVGIGVDLDAWHDGTDVAYRLLEMRRPAASDVLNAALSASFAESTVLLLAMAVSLAGLEARVCSAMLSGASPTSPRTRMSPN